ncbi:hypothetical protein LCGC14_0383610 [marine sediment metagenome]|uniref:Uncharacterized protein n=1 Tax=marine sediment metagenome TaxID=412755 RepID=A0A0F9TJU8_9ZZZZ
MTTPVDYVTSDGKQRSFDVLFRNRDFLFDVSRGKVKGAVPIHIIGNNDDTSTSLEDMWEGTTSGIYVFPAAGGIQMEVVSGSIDDASAGSGVQKVMIHYLDDEYKQKDEIVTLNGQNPVNTVATNILRVQNMHSLTVGSGGVAAGAITLESTDSTVEYTRIRAGINTSLTGVWTVPKGLTFYITKWATGAISTGANRTSEFFLRATSSFHGLLLPGVFNVKDISHLQVGTMPLPLDIPIQVPAKADVKVSVVSSAAMDTACRIDGWCEENG